MIHVSIDCDVLQRKVFLFKRYVSMEQVIVLIAVVGIFFIHVVVIRAIIHSIFTHIAGLDGDQTCIDCSEHRFKWLSASVMAVCKHNVYSSMLCSNNMQS